MKRVLLKLSGEALANGSGEIYDITFVDKVASVLKECMDKGHEVAIVVGAGNIWRGRTGGEMDRTNADRMGMLATVINCICVKDALVRVGAEAVVMTAIPMYPFAELYSADAAKAALSGGKIVIFGAGMGVPFLSTDTAAAVRAAEISADAILMAKNVDYLYTDDPRKNPDAKWIPTVEEITPEIQALAGGAGSGLGSGGMATKIRAAKIVMDAGIDMVIMNGERPDLLYDLFQGEAVGTRFLGKKG